MSILTKAAKAAAAAKRAAALAKKKAAEVAARKKAAKARAADKNKPKAKPSVQLRDKADDAARAKADKAAEGLKGSGESLSTKLRKEAKAKAAKAGPKKTGTTPGKKKDTPEAAEKDRKADGQRVKDRASKNAQATTQRKGSIAKEINVTKTDINQAEDKLELDAYENKVNDMPAGDIKTMLKKMIKAKRKAFQDMQAAEVDKVGRKSSQANRDKKDFKGYDPSKALPFNKGGMPMVMKDGKKVPAYAADGIGKMNKGGMAMKKSAKKMMAGGMAKKKPAAKKMMAGGMAKKKMMGGGMAKTGYMYGGMAKKTKAKK
jgi:hypothetical protein